MNIESIETIKKVSISPDDVILLSIRFDDGKFSVKVKNKYMEDCRKKLIKNLIAAGFNNSVISIPADNIDLGIISKEDAFLAKV